MSHQPSAQPPLDPVGPVRVGISSCLLGEPVRYDGGHKRDAFITSTLGRHFEFVPVCPEAEIGLGVPRETIRLVGDPVAPRALQGAELQDVSAALSVHGERVAAQSGSLSGYIFKSGSPSCGMERVDVYATPARAPRRKGRGLYAQALLRALPLLPAEEESGLGDPARRDNFIERVFAYRRWQALLAERPALPDLIRFHECHRLALLTHGWAPARELEGLLATAPARPLAQLLAAYGRGFMAALARRATPRSRAAALRQLLGYLEHALDADAKDELLQAIAAVRQGRMPLLVPLTLLAHHLRRHPHPEVAGQTLLHPSPAERLLRAGT